LNVDDDGDGNPDVSDICGELYGEAAKCNKYMGDSGVYAVCRLKLSCLVILVAHRHFSHELHLNSVASVVSK
jgi:hypothetical protein